MIYSVGIDLHQGRHRARCLDERAQPCDGFSFQTTPEGLAVLEERVFRDGAHPFIVLEPAGLPWKMVAVKGAPVSKDAGSSSKPRVSDTREAFPGRFGN